MNCFLVVLFWVMGVVGMDDGHADRIRARGKCREIRAQRYEVIVRFTSEEDARLFAEDLKNFIKE